MITYYGIMFNRIFIKIGYHEGTMLSMYFFGVEKVTKIHSVIHTIELEIRLKSETLLLEITS